MVTPVGLVKAEMVWNGLATSRRWWRSFGRARGRSYYASDSGQLKRREQVVEKRKTEAIALA